MKTVFLSYEAPPFGGGAGVYFSNIANLLSGKIRSYTHFRSKGNNNESTDYFYFPRRLWYIFLPVFIFYFAVKYKRVIVNDPPFIYSSGFLPSFLLRKVVVVVHGRERRLEKPDFFDKFFLFNLFYRRSFKYSFKVVYVSEFIKEVYCRIYNIEQSDFDIIHNGVAKFTVKQPKPRRQERLRLITASRLVEGKGVLEVLCDLTPFLLTTDATWEIYGDGPIREKLESYIKDNGLQDKVKLFGSIPQDRLYKAYSNSDCFILSSKLEESFGLVYLEAASQGCAVIANPKHGTKEALHYVEKWYSYDSLKLSEILSDVRNDKVLNRCNRYIDNVVEEFYCEDIIL
ncbi:glycosyltransferase family 4 protein [Vibrio gigantis]|uniref:glycosyltransferase family 4 protein n=1 Tax=Vibrio gigantis TaxID=296199 RepID=UPI002FC7E1EA